LESISCTVQYCTYRLYLEIFLFLIGCVPDQIMSDAAMDGSSLGHASLDRLACTHSIFTPMRRVVIQVETSLSLLDLNHTRSGDERTCCCQDTLCLYKQ
jgi:hypothetical protein